MFVSFGTSSSFDVSAETRALTSAIRTRTRKLPRLGPGALCRILVRISRSLGRGSGWLQRQTERHVAGERRRKRALPPPGPRLPPEESGLGPLRGSGNLLQFSLKVCSG